MAELHSQIVLPFPVKGKVTAVPRTGQPPETTPDCLNVLAYDPTSLRPRGGQRGGTLTVISGLGDGNHGLQALDVEAWIDPPAVSENFATLSNWNNITGWTVSGNALIVPTTGQMVANASFQPPPGQSMTVQATITGTASGSPAGGSGSASWVINFNQTTFALDIILTINWLYTELNVNPNGTGVELVLLNYGVTLQDGQGNTLYPPGSSSQHAINGLIFDGVNVTAHAAGAGNTITVTGQTVAAGLSAGFLRVTGGTNFVVGGYDISSVTTSTITVSNNVSTGSASALVATSTPFVTFNGSSVTGTTSGSSATITVSGATVLTAWVGATLIITGGTNYTHGTYTINSVNTGSNTITLNTTVSTASASGLVGTLSIVTNGSSITATTSGASATISTSGFSGFASLVGTVWTFTGNSTGFLAGTMTVASQTSGTLTFTRQLASGVASALVGAAGLTTAPPSPASLAETFTFTINPTANTFTYSGVYDSASGSFLPANNTFTIVPMTLALLGDLSSAGDLSIKVT